jgi:hypothetical protein
MSTNYDFIEIGAAVCPKYGTGTPGLEHSGKTIEYITEILGDLIITTGGSYSKEDIESVIIVAKRVKENQNFTENVIKSFENKLNKKE